MLLESKILEPAIDPSNRMTFLLDWELTMKCNLDCDYCATGIYGGHDNSTKHPPLNECLRSIDFMFEYVDLYMSKKPRALKYVTLNVYGGEALYHPDIIEILENVHKKYQSYRDRWTLTVTSTTNAIIPEKKLNAIIPFIDHFMVSYHTNNTDKQKDQFKKNSIIIRNAGKNLKCIVLMHAEQELFEDAQKMIQWCKDHNVNYFSKQLDDQSQQFLYQEKQIKWFKKIYQQNSYQIDTSDISIKKIQKGFDLATSGRSCCGGRQLCADKNYKQRTSFTANRFTDWYCSVDEFFLFIKQVNGEIYVNKDCKMDFNGNIGPIGNLVDTRAILDATRRRLDSDNIIPIQCKRDVCRCGLCAPKAESLVDFQQIIGKYRQ